jgi:hypothetical protein
MEPCNRSEPQEVKHFEPKDGRAAVGLGGSVAHSADFLDQCYRALELHPRVAVLKQRLKLRNGRRACLCEGRSALLHNHPFGIVQLRTEQRIRDPSFDRPATQAGDLRRLCIGMTGCQRRQQLLVSASASSAPTISSLTDSALAPSDEAASSETR